MTASLMPNYARLDIAFSRGQGVWLYDEHDRAYLDALCGIAVCNLGHAHAAVSGAVARQAERLVHTSNIYRIPLQEQLAERLTSLSGMQSAFFCNSGAEANEALIKIARLHGHARNIDVPVVVVMEQAFHGRTMATLTATGNPKAWQGFEPLLDGFVRIPYNDIGALRALAEERDDIAAVLVEPVQGEGGVNVPDADYLSDIRALCDRHDWLMMLDEVQTGMGRTGRWFAFQHADIRPDVISLAKALGNGVPVGAVLAAGPAAGAFQAGTHGSTFGGNPLACAAALAVIDTLEKDNLVARADALGQTLLSGFRQRLSALEGIRDIRGKGLMIGIELDRPCAGLVQAALQQQVLINVTAGNVVRLLPPLVLSDEEAGILIDKVSRVIDQWLQQAAA